MPMKPLIGITAHTLHEQPNRDWLYTPRTYMDSVQEAGGLPVLLPLTGDEGEAAALLDRVDGLLLAGGVDLDPQLYGEQPLWQIGEIDPERDRTELTLAREALRRDMPVLGICRGMQVLAVAEGGTLWQDLPAQRPVSIKHRQEAPRWHPTHTIAVQSGTRLAELLGPTSRVNSDHHQAVRTLPEGWVASAVAPDGIIEAMEHPGRRFALAVQWHPESFVGRSAAFAPLFEALVRAARR